MLPPDRTLHNTVTGHNFKFLRSGRTTDGERLVMEVTYPVQSNRPPMHYHPYQTEHFRVVSGEMLVVVGQQSRVLKAGDQLDVPPNTPHAMWNQGIEPTVMHWTVTPALQSEQLFETLIALANTGRTNREGVPGLLQAARTMRHFSREFRLTKPPFVVQQLLFGLLSPVAGWLGYRAVHQDVLETADSSLSAFQVRRSGEH